MPELYPPDPVDYDDEQNQSDAFKLYEEMPVIAPYSWQHLTVSAVQLAAEEYVEQEHLEERANLLLNKHALTPFFNMTPTELAKVLDNIDALEHAYSDGEPFTALLGIYILAELGDMLMDNIFDEKLNIKADSNSEDSYWQTKQKELPVKERFLAALRKNRGHYYD